MSVEEALEEVLRLERIILRRVGPEAHEAVGKNA